MTPHPTRSLPRLAFALTLAGALAGCGSAAPPPATTPAHANPVLTSATSAAPAGAATSAPARQAAGASDPRVSPVRTSPAAKSSSALPPELPPSSSGSSFHVATDADMAAAARANQASQQAIESTLK